TGYALFNAPTFLSLALHAVALQADGKIVVVGSANRSATSNDALVIRYNSNGTLDTTFGGGSGYITLDIDGTASRTGEIGRGVAIQPDSKIVIAGQEYAAGGAVVFNALVAHINRDGMPDLAFGKAASRSMRRRLARLLRLPCRRTAVPSRPAGSDV